MNFAARFKKFLQKKNSEKRKGKNMKLGRECLLPCDEPAENELQADCDLMNEAWAIAKKAQFKAIDCGCLTVAEVLKTNN